METIKIDFNYIDMLAEDDQAFKLDYVNTFEKTFRDILPKMDAELESKNLEQLGKLAHQLKPSAKMIKLPSADLIEQVQHEPSVCTVSDIANFQSEFEQALTILKEWAKV